MQPTASMQVIFFLSGAGALVFENVWFSELGLVVGNSVWSAALVTGAFMAGLAIGNSLAIALASRLSNLVRVYGYLEVAAAISGALLVLVFPVLPVVFAPLFAPFLDHAAMLNPLRLGIAFASMVIPAAALGATLPMLAKPLAAASGSYGWALGRLYGLNTLGAVAGTLLAELALIPGLGLKASGSVAAACNLTAALVALRLARLPAFEASRSASTVAAVIAGANVRRLMLAAFLAGGALLALEVLWYRFLLMFITGYTLIFALMLAVVLAGIGMGGMAASRWSRRGWSASTVARIAAAGGAVGVVGGYSGFDAAWRTVTALQLESLLAPALLSAFLMGPVCFLSGVLFTALGDQLRGPSHDAATATGILTLANTLGAMSGSLLAAFVLIPRLGLESAFFWLAGAYVAVTLIIPMQGASRRLATAFVAAAAVAVVLFPFGRMTGVHYRHVEDRFAARLVAVREGIAETAFYLANDFLGEPLDYRLATNAYSMSGTGIRSQRYMKLFAYLPAALHPRLEHALLVCFGVGATASALTDLPDVKSIDVVDVSRDILEMSDIVHPDPQRNPLRDPRVRVHVEDGRFFLQQARRRYDLITGEPPPPKIAGVASLYTREYFELLRSRLNPGGIATYWLPVNQLRERDALAILHAFCAAFEDCTLWSGMGLDWIMMGSRGGVAPVAPEMLARLWRQDRSAGALRRIAIEGPEQLLALFLADARTLRAIAAQVPPLVDDFPRRLSPEIPTLRAEPLYARLMDAATARARFDSSPWVAAVVPRALAAASREAFRSRGMLDAVQYPELRRADFNPWFDLAQLLRGAGPPTLPLWLLQSEQGKVEIAQRRAATAAQSPLAVEHRMIGALVTRRPPAAGLDRAQFQVMTPRAQLVSIFHRCLAGDVAAARSLVDWIPQDRHAVEPYRPLLAWWAAECANR